MTESNALVAGRGDARKEPRTRAHDKDDVCDGNHRFPSDEVCKQARSKPAEERTQSGGTRQDLSSQQSEHRP